MQEQVAPILVDLVRNLLHTKPENPVIYFFLTLKPQAILDLINFKLKLTEEEKEEYK